MSTLTNIPLFNKDHLNRQSRQIINSAYVQMSYIQQECKPFLSLFQKGFIPPLKTNTKLKFQTLPQNNNVFDDITTSQYNNIEIVDLNPKGKFVVFPAGEFKIFWNKGFPRFSKETVETLPKINWNTSDLENIVEDNITILISTRKLYVIENAMYQSIQQKLRSLYLGKNI